jgi:hypothetical protein
MSGPVTWRSVADAGGAWRDGQLLNASDTGLLFETTRPTPPVASPIEFVFTFERRHGPHGAHVHGRGHVVRSLKAAGDTAAMATTIDTYTILQSAIDR